MTIFHWILVAIIMSYVVLMFALMIGWLFLLKRKLPEQIIHTNLSVLIPFRNESENITGLISSLSKLEYDKNSVEFIFIDDHSTDNGKEILSTQLIDFPFEYQIISLDESRKGKKQALQHGVYLAKFPHIITTDADCVYSSKWLLEINNLLTQNVDFVILPILNIHRSGMFSNLQEMESLMLTGVSLGAAYFKKPVLCSGANLAYSKSLFTNLVPYKGNLNVKSGDDMFFLKKLLKEKNVKIGIGASPDVVVQTNSSVSFRDLFLKSIRWASKTRQLSIFRTSFFGAIVLITNYSILLMGALIVFNTHGIDFFIKLCGIKTIVDVLFLFLLANYYKRLKVLVYLPIMVVYYPIYLMFVSIGGFFITPIWKGR